MKKIIFSAVPEVAMSVFAWLYASCVSALIVTAVCVYVSYNVYRSL